MKTMQHPNPDDDNTWRSEKRVNKFITTLDNRPHVKEISRFFCEEIPTNVTNVLDLGTGDGRILEMVKLKNPTAKGVALDFSEPMLKRVKNRFQNDKTVKILKHDLNNPIPKDIGEPFDLVISGLAIHHVDHPRKKQLYTEIYDILTPKGLFLNLDNVAMSTEALHQKFLAAVGMTPQEDDPANKLLDVHTQLQWLRQIGFKDVDCLFKWLEVALLAGTKP
jgi:SAM-dependent methyltransferase